MKVVDNTTWNTLIVGGACYTILYVAAKLRHSARAPSGNDANTTESSSSFATMPLTIILRSHDL